MLVVALIALSHGSDRRNLLESLGPEKIFLDSLEREGGGGRGVRKPRKGVKGRLDHPIGFG